MAIERSGNAWRDLSRIHVRDGLSQQRRQLAALQPGYFDIDELRFEQLLSLLQDYARLVQFHDHDPDDDDDGNPLLFSNNELVVMSGILAIDLPQLEYNIRERLDTFGPERLLQDSSPTSPLGLVRQFDRWLGQLRQPQSSAGEQLYSLLESVLTGLRGDMQALFLSTQQNAEQPRLVSRHFYEAVMTGAVTTYSATPDAVLNIQALYAALVKAIDMLQAGCREYLPTSLRCQQHDPALALRVVFVRLYQRLQKRLNRFTLNLADFYFSDVLQARPLPLRPDSIYLVMHPGPQVKAVEIPAGTRFIAGVDVNGADIIYAADEDLTVNDAQVVQIHNLFFSGADTVAGQKLSDGCWLDSLTTVPGADKKARTRLLPRPLFGAGHDCKPVRTARTARLGFVIAHKILALREGRRELTLDLQYQDIPELAWSQLRQLLNDLPAASNFGGEGDTREKAKFFAYFGSMFELSVTTATGWYRIKEFKPAYASADAAVSPNCLRLNFYLAEDAPAVTPYAAAIHGDDFQTATPLLRVLLKDNFQQYPYDLLRCLVIRDIRIEVEVQGCRDLLLHNNIGQLSSLAPFAPFGPLPDIGSYFIVGCQETCNKQLTALSIDIEWKGLPDEPGGFGDWYREYSPRRESSHFVVSTSVLTDGLWQPKAPPAALNQQLFSSAIANGAEYLLPEHRLFATNVLPYHKVQDTPPGANGLSFTPHTKSGLFKFMLQGPAGAFGHREYTQVLAGTLTYNSRVKLDRLARPLPNPPYTPEIAAVRLNYSAAARLSLHDSEASSPSELRDQFIHLHPLGWEAISPLRHPRIFQVPQYLAKGSLFIGIEASECGQLNLLFHLLNDSLPMKPVGARIDAGQGALLEWAWLADNQWHPLPAAWILGDSTHGFKTAGIVSLRVPPAINRRNTILPPGLFWLRVTASEQLNSFSHISSIYAQALKVSWQSGEHPPGPQPMVLAPDSIVRTRNTLPGIVGVTQIAASFGGVPPETPAQLRTRTSERLRHKQRALTPLDYEMLILQEFPQVHKVKCFANLRSTLGDAIAPGHLLIIPVPFLQDGAHADFKPHFDGYMIERIRDFVVALAPAFCRISVENPLYEEIQVRCAVQLKKGCHPGKHHNLLHKALCDYLSPWSPHGNNVHFGWRISKQEIKSHIHNQPYIDHVADFALLRVAPRHQDHFILDDTGSERASTGRAAILLPSYLWSTAVPLTQHYLVSITDAEQTIELQTGYDELEIGSTFIIS